MRNLARFATIFSILTAAPPGAFAQQRPPGTDGDQKRNDNRGPVAISSIGFEEGPNNTVISITTSATPTFTVFKLVDPVRLLVDVAGGDVSVATPRVQVRNGVIHDIETAQFASQGKTIGRIVIGFDVEASYSVKTDGNTIRIVIDGAERMTGKLGDAQSAELVKKAQAAIEAEKQLREELLAARARETTLVENERSAKNAVEQLQSELDRVAADSKRLQALLDAARDGRGDDAQLTDAAAQKAEEQRKTLEAAAEAARQKVAALSAEQQQLEAERAALKRAVDAAEKRKTELSNALAAEEARREAARRSRQEEEQLASAAKAARVAEETRIEALRDVGSAEADKNEALAKAKKDAEQLRVDGEKSAARVAELETALAAAKKSEGASGKTTSKLEGELEKVKRERDLAVKAADKAKREAELDLSEKTDLHASALERLRAANDNLEAQLADQKKQATLAERAKRTFEEKLEESARAIDALKRRDEERLVAEAEVARLEKERVQSAQRARDLERDNKTLIAKAERLEAEKTALQRAVSTGRKVEGIEDVLASQTAELARIKGAIEDARGERTEATRSREAAEKEADSVRVKLARERADLAAVLQQKELFGKEIATLRERRDSLSRDASAEEQRLQAAQVRLKRLEGERTAAEEKVATLRQEVARLEGSRREEGSRDTLEDRLAAKNGEIAEKKAEIAALQKTLTAEKASGQDALSERDKRLNAALDAARAEARKSEEGQKKLAQLEKFLASQRTEIDKLRAGDKSGALAQKERELAALQKDLAAVRAQNEKAGPAVLQTARAELKAAESRLSEVETQLAREQKARTIAENDLAEAKGQIGTLEAEARSGKTELAAAKRRIEELTRLSADASGDVERLEKKLAAARADGDGGKAIADELAHAKIALRNTEKQLAEAKGQIGTLEAEARSGKTELAAAKRRIEELTRLSADASGDVERLEKKLAAARADGDGGKAIAEELAGAKIALRNAEKQLAAEQREREADAKEAAARVSRLEGEKDTLKAKIHAQEKALASASQSGDNDKELARARQKIAELSRDLTIARVQSKQSAEIERLQSEKAKLQAELARREKPSGDVAETTKLRQELASAKSAERKLEAELAEARAHRTEAAELARLSKAVRAAEARAETAEARADSAEQAGRKTREALSAAEARLATLSDEKEQTEQRVTRLEKELSTARRGGEDASALERELTEARSARTRLERAMDDAEKTLAEVTRERDSARKDARAAESRATTAEKARAKAGEALAAANAKLETLGTEREEAEARVARLEADVVAARKAGNGTSSLSRELDEARREQERLEKTVAGLKRAAREAEAATVAAKSDLAETKRELARLKEDKADAEKRVAAVERELAAARSTGNETRSISAELAEARTERDRLAATMARLQRAMAEAEAERDVARQDADAAVKATSVAQRRADEAKKDAETAKADLRAAKARISRLQADAEAADERVASVEKQLKSAQARGGNTSALTAELEGAKDDLARAQQELKAERSEREAIRKEASAEVARLEADKKSLEKDLAEAKRSGRSGGDDRLAATLQAKEAEIAALTSQLATARSHAGAAEELARVVAESEKARADLQKAQERISSLEKERTLDKSTAQAESALTRITNVAFHEKNNVSRVEIELDGKAGYEVVEKTDQKMVLVVDKARIPKLLERRLDTRDFYGPVATVSSFTDPDDDSKVRVVVELNEAVKNQITRRGNALVWEFYNGQRVHMGDRAYASADDDGRSGVQFRPSAVGGERSEPFGSAPPVGGVTLPGGGGGTVPLSPQAYSRKRSTGRKYKGQKINLSIKDADIQQVLTFLAREGGVNIVTGQAVQGTVTVHLKDVPWDLALDMVLKSQGLDYVEEDGVYRVALAEAIRTEFEAEVEKRKKMNELRQLVVKLVSVNYADAEQISAQVKGVLSEKGTVTVDARTNTLIIKDVEEHVLAGEDIVRRLDTQTPQVLIEARIVEASSNFTEDIGIQWGGNYTASPAFGNETGLVFPAIVGFSGAADDATSPVTGLLQDQPKFAVNLPAAVGAGSGGGIALTLGSLTGAGNLNLRLTAAEERGQLKIISSPRIATLDNNQATIRQGISIPISVVSSLGVNTQFFNAELALQVTPQVTQDGNVNLAVNITKNEPNFSQTGANGNPTIERKEATTQLLVRDGDTAVIGGIYTRNASQDFKKVPVLADIPFLGWLFKNRTVVDKRTELILFITPRIINRAAARVRVD